MIVEDIEPVEPQVFTPKRTEYGKAVRKDYESHKIQESRHNMTELIPRNDGISNTITTVQKDNILLEPQSCAMRGRYEEDGSTEQHLELGSEEAANCITSVSKDSMIMEKEVVGIKQATKKGYIECEVGGVCDLSYPDSKYRRGRVQGNGQISPTLTANGGICRIEPKQELKYRIRKLTERECWRLMGFSDEDFEKAAEVNSRTQLYKEAGNSIVKNVLVGIFGQLFEGKEDIYKKVEIGAQT